MMDALQDLKMGKDERRGDERERDSWPNEYRREWKNFCGRVGLQEAFHTNGKALRSGKESAR